MINEISTPVSVSLIYDYKRNRVYPKSIVWNSRVYPILKIGFHHTYYEGKVLYHVFSVAGKTLFFRLIFNTANLHWKLDAVYDGLSF